MTSQKTPYCYKLEPSGSVPLHLPHTSGGRCLPPGEKIEVKIEILWNKWPKIQWIHSAKWVKIRGFSLPPPTYVNHPLALNIEFLHNEIHEIPHNSLIQLHPVFRGTSGEGLKGGKLREKSQKKKLASRKSKSFRAPKNKNKKGQVRANEALFMELFQVLKAPLSDLL